MLFLFQSIFVMTLFTSFMTPSIIFLKSRGSLFANPNIYLAALFFISGANWVNSAVVHLSLLVSVPRLLPTLTAPVARSARLAAKSKWGAGASQDVPGGLEAGSPKGSEMCQ